MWFNAEKLVESKAAPMFNEDFPSVYRGLVNKPSVYEDITYWIERTPEAIAILSAITTDMKPYSYRFIGGKQAMNKAREFCNKNNFSDNYSYALWDWLEFGDGYLWKGFISDSQSQEAYTAAFKSASALFYVATGIEYKAHIFNYKDFSDEDALKSVKHVPTNTMNIDHNKKEITGFRQLVGTDELTWSPDKIIHNKLITLNGKVYGFSPSQASLTEMNTLGYLKDYAGTFFKNGGVPDWMFILPKEIAGSKNHEALIQRLQKYKHPSSKHGNLVFTGEVEPHQLNKFDKDMEFRQLAVYLTGVLALAFNMPMSRVAAIIGSEVKVSAGSDDLSNEGYWNKIDEMQSSWERILNSQLFQPYFGVDIRFDRGYKQNEIREVQRAVQAGEAVAKINQLLGNHSKQVNLAYVKSMFYLDDSDLQTGKAENIENLGTKESMSNQEMNQGPAREALSKEKKKQVIPSQKETQKSK